MSSVCRSLAPDEFLDGTLGDRSKSESERYRKDSRRWLWGKLAWITRPEPGEAWASRGLRPTESPFSTSKPIHECLRVEKFEGVFLENLESLFIMSR